MRVNVFACGCALALCLTACGGDGAGSSPETSRDLQGEYTLRAVDATETVDQPAACEVTEDADGNLRLSSKPQLASQSLYLHLRYDPLLHGTASAALNPALKERALLLAIEKEAGLLRIGLTSLGEGILLPADSELLNITFSGQRAQQPERSASAAPATAVADLELNMEEQPRLEWTYYVNGDYDQNGSVTIGDVTPIGQHFGKTESAAGWEIAQVADGDLNGLISISDLTPIGANFGSRVSSFAVRTAATAAGPFSFVSGSLTAFADFPQPQAGGPRRFSHTLANIIDGNFYVVSARDGAEESDARSNAVVYDPGNLAPVVEIQGEDTVPPGQQRIFDASFSDGDGTVEFLRWDLDGNGSFETAGDPLNSPVMSLPFNEMGTAQVGVRVTDDKGQHGYDVHNIAVDFGERVNRLLDSGDSFREPDLINANGRPLIACVAFDAFEALVYRPTTDSVTTWFTPQPLPDSNSWAYIALNNIGVVPGIAAQPYGAPQFYGLASDPYGEEWDIYERDLFIEDESFTPALCLADRSGLPVMVYGEYVGASIEQSAVFYISGAENGLVWNNPVFLGISAGSGRASMVVIAGRSHVVFEGGEVDATIIEHTMAENEAETEWSDTISVGAPLNSFYGNEGLAVVDGDRLGVAFWDRTAGSLGFSVTAPGSVLEWSDPVVVANTGDTYSEFSLAIINDLPQIAYYDSNLPGFRLVCAKDNEGGQWNEPLEIAVCPTRGGVSLAERAGRPMLAYVDGTAEELHFVMFTDPLL